jgi:hypothetical protein
MWPRSPMPDTDSQSPFESVMRDNSREPVSIERVIPWIIAIAACSLLSVGVHLALTDRSGSAATAWGFGFLLFILLLLTKFKPFKGFGFEAELWEQKQAEAAALIDQLKTLSKLISKQMASVAARIGLWDSALSLAELAEFVEGLQQQLKAIEVPSHEAEEVLQKMYQRIEAAYYAEARHELSTAVGEASAAIHGGLSSTDMEEHRKATSLVPDLDRESQVASTLSLVSINALIEFVSDSKIIESKSEIIEKLNEIERDLRHFQLHRSFRRREWLPMVAQ